MIILLEASMKGMGAPPPSAPALQMPGGVSWSEDPLRWQLSLPAEPTQVAAMIRRHKLQADIEHPYLWSSQEGNAELRLTVASQDSEWKLLQKALQDQEKVRNSPLGHDQLRLEWPFLHPALSQLKKGNMRIGPAWLECSPADSRMVMYLPADSQTIDSLRESGYLLQPSNEWQEDIMWGEVIMGRLLKPSSETEPGPEGSAPFLILHGLESSLVNRSLMRPFAAPLEIAEREEMLRIIKESCQEQADLLPPEDETDSMDRTFRQEYSGFAIDDLELLLRTAIGFTEGIATDCCEDHDLESLSEEWMRQVFQVMVASLIAGSRVARAELARAGYQTALEQELGESNLSDLINGQLSFADAMRRAVRDNRAWRCWSLQWGDAQAAELILEELLEQELPQDPAPEAVLGDILVCFDLGVRYQMARVAPLLLAVPETSWQEED